MCYERENLSKIKEILNTHNATHPPQEPFDMNMGHGGLDLVGMLGLAASQGQIEYVKWFLDNGASPWKENFTGETPLYLAMARDVMYEMDYGSNDKDPPNSAMGTVTTLLHHIENYEKPHNVYYAPNVWERRNMWQSTPLDYSAIKRGVEVLKLFISKRS